MSPQIRVHSSLRPERCSFHRTGADMTVVLDVRHAGCVLSGPIVKNALAHVPGVKSIKVSRPNSTADVTASVSYDPAAATPVALIKAVTDRGGAGANLRHGRMTFA